MNDYIIVQNENGKDVKRLVANLRYVIYEKGEGRAYFNYCDFGCKISLKDIIYDYPQIGLILLHQCYLVNEKYISKIIDFNHLLVTMINGKVFKVSYRLKRFLLSNKIDSWMELLLFLCFVGADEK
jgi:uncharacterized protein YlzI (FlbEa/FlbD family)